MAGNIFTDGLDRCGRGGRSKATCVKLRGGGKGLTRGMAHNIEGADTGAHASSNRGSNTGALGP